MKRALAVMAVALAVPTAAGAHVTVSPPFVEDGVETDVAFATPNERPPHATVAVRVTAPPGIAVVSSTAPAGWQARVTGSTVTWSGGRIEDRTTISFPVRIVARVRAGTYAFISVQRYNDGATVSWKANLSVLPATGAAAPRQHLWSAVIAACAGIIVIAGSLVGVRLLRRSSLQDR